MRYAKYKPTNIPWFPEVPEGWEVAMVGHCYDIQLGKMLCSEQRDASYSLEPYYCAANVHFEGVQTTGLKQMWFSEEEKKVYRVLNGDLLIVEGGAGAGGSAIVKNHQQEAYIQNSILRVRHHANTDNTFLCYWMEAIVKRGYVDVVCNKATIPHFTKEKVSRVPFPLPPLAEQRAIVAFLDGKCGKIDRWVTAKEREVALLKELKQAMIAEAVTGVTNVSRTDTARQMKPSGIPWLPEIPEGWEVKRLVSLLSNEVKSNKDFIYSRALKFNYGTLIPKNELGDPEEYRDVYVKYSLLQKGDIVINGLNLNYDFNSMRVACAPCDGIITSAYIVCRPRMGIDTSYFTYLFKAMDYQKMFHGMGTGIRLTLSFNELRGQVLPVPPLAEQRAIVAYIEARAAKIDAAVAGLEREVAAMKEYKQRLIAEVVTGQRRVG